MVSAAKGGEAVQVVVRVRPLSENEVKGGKYIAFLGPQGAPLLTILL